MNNKLLVALVAAFSIAGSASAAWTSIGIYNDSSVPVKVEVNVTAASTCGNMTQVLQPNTFKNYETHPDIMWIGGCFISEVAVTNLQTNKRESYPVTAVSTGAGVVYNSDFRVEIQDNAKSKNGVVVTLQKGNVRPE